MNRRDDGTATGPDAADGEALLRSPDTTKNKMGQIVLQLFVGV